MQSADFAEVVAIDGQRYRMRQCPVAVEKCPYQHFPVLITLASYNAEQYS